MNFTDKSAMENENTIILSAWNHEDDDDEDQKDSKLYLDALHQAVSSTKTIQKEITADDDENGCDSTKNFVKEEPKNIVKQELESLSKEDLLNILMEKLLIIENFKSKCNNLEEKMLGWKAKTKTLTKNCQDMGFVMKNLILDLQNKNLCPRPVKMVRSVGVQVTTNKCPGSSEAVGILTLKKHFTTESLTSKAPNSHAPVPINIKIEADSPSKFANFPNTPPITPENEPDLRKTKKAKKRKKSSNSSIFSSKAKALKTCTSSTVSPENYKKPSSERGLEEAREKDITQLSLVPSHNKEKPLPETSRNENNLLLATVADRKEAIFSTEQSQTNIFDAEKSVIGDLFSSDDDEEEIEKNVEKGSSEVKTGENENDEENDIATGELFSSEND